MESGFDDAELIESGELTGSIVSLADVRTSGVKFEWYEALATVLQLCHGITESTDQAGPTTVNPDTVFIAPAGDVIALTRPQHPATAVPRVAEIFGEMLPDFHRRSTFRMVIAEATSAPPVYASLEELAEALEPFERPHRVEIVQGVYQRWTAIAALAEPAEANALDVFISEKPRAKAIVTAAAIPKAAVAVVKSLPWRSLWHRRSLPRLRPLHASALAVLAVTIVGLGIWTVRSSRRTPVVSGPVAATVNSTPDAQKAEAPLDTAEHASEIPVQPNPPATTPEPGAPRVPATQVPATLSVTAPTIAPVKPAAPGRPVQPPRSVQATPGPPTIAALAPAAATIAIEPRPTVVAPPPAPTLRTAAPAAPSEYVSSAGTTFSASDPDVVPPVPDSSQQLWRMPASSRRSDLMTVEIVVDERGAVQSVKAQAFPGTLADTAALMMSLSAVKTWHFSPALKDGHPVKFRQVVSLTMH